MRNLFLCSSFADVSDLFVKLTAGKHEGQAVTFIPTASLTEEIISYVDAGRKTLEKLGLLVEELEISTAPKDEIESTIKNNDYIYITGGNTFFLLQELKRTGADQIITEQINAGKTYIGESAGSIVLSGNITYVKDMDDFRAAPKLGSFSSLNIVDFYPVPHHTNVPFKDSVENIIANYADALNLLPISNAQAIIVQDDGYEVWTSET